MHAPALKQTAKRTVFGDMSNMAPARMHKDDSALSEKMSHEKAVQIITEKAKANAALMRPAQRPANTAAAKPHSFGTTSEDNALATRMPLESLIAANARKTVAKKSTTVFKDNAPVATTNAVVPVSKPAVSHDQNSAEYLASVQERLRLAAETNFPYNASHTAGRSNNALKSNLIRAPATLVPSNAESFNPYADLYRPYNPATGNPIVMQGPSSKDAPAPRARVVREESRAGGLPRATVNPLQIAAAPETKLPTAQVKVETDAQKENAIVPYAANHNLTEPEEYWPEEEDNYEDDGYVTARSCYSRGDNTTGGVTTVIFPRVTGLVKKELAQAAIAVESVRTEEDIEDERWDTSMVAEYGEEIFSYMRELEVCFLLCLLTSSTDIRRSKCFPTLTTWTSRTKSSGRCAASLWTGSFRCTIASTSCLRLCSSRSTTSTASSRPRSSPSADSSSSVPLPCSLLPNMKRSTVLASRRLYSWLTVATRLMRSSRRSDSC